MDAMTQANAKLRVELQDQLRFETLLSDISARFINVPADQVDAEIKDAQRRVCECLGLDVSALWQSDPDNQNSYAMTHYRLPPGVLPDPRMEASERFPWHHREILAGRRVVISSIDDAP